MLHVTFDEALGIIRTASCGASTPEQQQDYVSRKQSLNETARRKRGRILHLVDARDSVIQSKFAMDRLALQVGAPRLSDDRTAVLVKGQASRIQLSAPNGKGEIRFFTDEEQAMIWLLEANLSAKAS
jgi:hypothetical protein